MDQSHFRGAHPPPARTELDTYVIMVDRTDGAIPLSVFNVTRVNR